MRSVFVLLLFALPAVAAPVPKSVKKDPQPLNGTWEVVEWYVDETRMQLSDTILWSIDGEKLAVRGVREEVPVGFLSNASRTITKPEGGAADAIDYTITSTDGTAPSHRPAVFELEKDRFSICMTTTHNGGRPAECKPIRGTIMYVLKRAETK